MEMEVYIVVSGDEVHNCIDMNVLDLNDSRNLLLDLMETSCSTWSNLPVVEISATSSWKLMIESKHKKRKTH